MYNTRPLASTTCTYTLFTGIGNCPGQSPNSTWSFGYRRRIEAGTQHITAKDKPSTRPRMGGGQSKRLKGQEGLGKGCVGHRVSTDISCNSGYAGREGKGLGKFPTN